MQPKKRIQAQKGISLIESLVALIILALGILGLAGIQTRTLTEARLTNARAVAVRMVGDIQERMKVNSAALQIAPNPYLTNWGAVPAPTNCNTTACTPAQLAGFDLSQWKVTLAAALPNGDGRVYQSANDPTVFGVFISWTNNIGAQAVGDEETYNAPFDIDTGIDGVACPNGSICHLTMIRP